MHSLSSKPSFQVFKTGQGKLAEKPSHCGLFSLEAVNKLLSVQHQNVYIKVHSALTVKLLKLTRLGIWFWPDCPGGHQLHI